MSVHTFTIPATVDAKAAGVSITMDVNSFHSDAIAAIFAYGARRWMQDYVNAAAHSFKQAKAEAEAKGETFAAEFDAESVIAARIAQAVSGNMSTRTSGNGETFSAFDDTLYEVAVSVRASSKWPEISTAWSLSKGKPTAERKRLILDTIESLPDPRKLALHRVATERLALAESLSTIDI